MWDKYKQKPCLQRALNEKAMQLQEKPKNHVQEAIAPNAMC